MAVIQLLDLVSMKHNPFTLDGSQTDWEYKCWQEFEYFAAPNEDKRRSLSQRLEYIYTCMDVPSPLGRC